mgnify:CR=1 FL=1
MKLLLLLSLSTCLWAAQQDDTLESVVTPSRSPASFRELTTEEFFSTHDASIIMRIEDGAVLFNETQPMHSACATTHTTAASDCFKACKSDKEFYEKVIFFRLRNYMAGARKIMQNHLGVDFAPTKEKLIPIFAALNSLNVDSDTNKRGITAFFLKGFGKKLADFDEKDSRRKYDELKGNKHQYFLNLGRTMIELMGDVPETLSGSYYNLIRPFFLACTMNMSIAEVRKYGLSSGLLPANLSQLWSIDPNTMEERIRSLQPLLEFSRRYRIKDVLTASYYSELLMYHAAHKRELAFSNSIQALDILEGMVDESQLLQPYMSLLFSSSTAAENQQFLERFSRFVPKLLNIYPEYFDARRPGIEFIEIWDILISGYISRLKSEGQEIDARFEAFKQSLREAQEAKSHDRESKKSLPSKPTREAVVEKIRKMQAMQEVADSTLQEQHRLQQELVALMRLEKAPKVRNSDTVAEMAVLTTTTPTQAVKLSAAQAIQREEEKAQLKHLRQRAACTSKGLLEASDDDDEGDLAPEFDNSPASLLEHFHVDQVNPIVGTLKGAQRKVLDCFFSTKTKENRSWQNNVEITMRELETLVGSLGGTVSRDRGKGGHFIIHFSECVEKLYNPALALKNLEGQGQATLATVIKLWDGDRLPPYLVEQIRNIFIAQGMIPQTFFDAKK